jgi:hypothetical protein
VGLISQTCPDHEQVPITYIVRVRVFPDEAGTGSIKLARTGGKCGESMEKVWSKRDSVGLMCRWSSGECNWQPLAQLTDVGESHTCLCLPGSFGSGQAPMEGPV